MSDDNSGKVADSPAPNPYQYLSPRARKAILLILGGATRKQAAEATGYDLRNFYTMLARPNAKRYMRDQQLLIEERLRERIVDKRYHDAITSMASLGVAHARAKGR